MKRKLVVLAAAALLGFLGSRQARADLLVGYLGDCTAVTATTCTESTATGYARQPIILSTPMFGKSVNSIPFSFAQTVLGTIAGRALFDAPTAGNLLVVMPLANPLTIAPPGDRADVGALSLTVTALAAVFNGSFSQAAVASGAAVGTTQDGSSATAATALTITRGQLYKAASITW
jgi:hypothetical protein